MELCPCGSGIPYNKCCEPLIKGARPAETAEQLMRSRYSAYVKKEIPYLNETLHPDQRRDFDQKYARDWAEKSEWHGLEIVTVVDGGPGDTAGKVEFIATYSQEGIKQKHHELADFKKEGGKWFFLDGERVAPKQVIREMPKTGRNDPCPCGSGKKFKKCCGE